MHYLVTGGCGFIGSHLVDRLLKEGHRVTVLDDLSSGKRERLAPHVRFMEGDITAPGHFDAVLPDLDGCFHLAAIVSVQRSVDEWLRTHQVNLGGTVALFEALAKAQRRIPVVFASSAAVYGDCADVPVNETMLCRPMSAYGADKLACEWQGRVAASAHGIPTIGLRFFNVYGPRQDPSSSYSGVISIFASKMKLHLPITIYGDGMQTRDFIYVGDIVDGVVAAMRKLESGQTMHSVFNLSTGAQTSVNQLAQLIADKTHSRSIIFHEAARAGDIRTSAGDPAQARKALAFLASTPLHQGLELTLKDIQPLCAAS